MPGAAAEALITDGLCQRYGCLPSALRDEDVEIMRIVALAQLATPEKAEY